LSNSFSMLVSQLHISADDRRTLTAAIIERVCVDTNSKIWHVSMKVVNPVTEEGLQVLRESLCNMYGLSSIHFDIKYLKKYVTLGEYLTERWDAVIDIIIEQIPSLQGWLRTARYTIQDESHFEVELNNCLALEIIKQKRCEQHLERIVQSELGRAVQIHFSAGEDGQTCDLFEEFQQQVGQQLHVVVTEKPSSGKNEKKTSSEPLFGRAIKEEATLIESVKDEERKSIVAGRIFAIDVRELRSGRQLVTFDMTDLTDSITVKVFLEEKDKSELPEKLKKNMWVKVRGPVQYDKFTQELTIMADSIVPISPKEERMVIHE
jgi:DNA polymerase-3 subunit alpha (Gram-positive type)